MRAGLSAGLRDEHGYFTLESKLGNPIRRTEQNVVRSLPQDKPRGAFQATPLSKRFTLGSRPVKGKDAARSGPATHRNEDLPRECQHRPQKFPALGQDLDSRVAKVRP